MSPSTRQGALYALLTVLLWSSLGVGLKLAVSRIGGYSATVYMIFCSTLALLAYLGLRRRLHVALAELRRLPIFFVQAGAIGLGLHQILYLTGYTLLPASQVVIIHYLWPLTMVAISALLFREPTRRLSVVFVCLGFVGLCIAILRESTLQLDLSAGVLITFAGSFCWALFSVMIKHRSFDIDTGMLLFHVFGLLLLLVMVPFYGLRTDLRWSEVLGFLYLGIFPTAISYLLWNRALRLAPTALCSNISLLMPVLSLIAIRLILDEPLRANQLAGFAIILLSVFLNLHLVQRREEISEPAARDPTN